MAKILVKQGKMLTSEGKAIISTASGGVADAFLFTPTITATDTSISISDTMNGAFVESYDVSVNNKIVLDTVDKTVDVTTYFTGSDSYGIKVRAKGLLSSSSYTNTCNYHTVKFYNDTTLLDTQIKLEGGKALYPATNPTKDGYDFLGYNTNKNASNRLPDLTVNSPMNLYAIFGQPSPDTIAIKSSTVEGTNLGVAAYNGIIYIFGKGNIMSYNPETDLLSTLTTTVGTGSCKAVTGNGIIYVYINKSLYSYNPTTNVPTKIVTQTLGDIAYVNGTLYGIVYSVLYKLNGSVFEVVNENSLQGQNGSGTGKLIVIGNSLYFNNSSNSTALYVMGADNLFTQHDYYFLHNAMSNYSTCVRNGIIYIFGGKEFGTSAIDKIYAYDVSTKTRTEKTAVLTEPLMNCTSVLVGEDIYIFGGTNNNATVNHLIMKYT